MNLPNVKEGQWIRVGDSNIKAYVFHVISDIEVSAGYYQNQAKAIKEEFVWNGASWQFKSSGQDGSYLHGSDEALIKRGPPRD